ncbi:MAG: hypothetical protein WAW36_17015 [Methylovulum miyakonense]|uniref:hypothetical protein n=1 Tax=Methylovulum miyakonense TaxID=645578 RepID=UPI003BB4A517
MNNLNAIFDGVIEDDINIKPPVAILKELGQELERITQGLLVTKVEQSNNGDDFYLEFYITAPSLNNYSYEVFSISHDINFYPLNVFALNQPAKNANNQEELEAIFKEIFSNNKVRKVINGLLAQIKSA